MAIAIPFVFGMSTAAARLFGLWLMRAVVGVWRVGRAILLVAVVLVLLGAVVVVTVTGWFAVVHT